MSAGPSWKQLSDAVPGSPSLPRMVTEAWSPPPGATASHLPSTAAGPKCRLVTADPGPAFPASSEASPASAHPALCP